jgi:uncharacterized protein (DUF1015 family)
METGARGKSSGGLEMTREEMVLLALDKVKGQSPIQISRLTQMQLDEVKQNLHQLILKKQCVSADHDGLFKLYYKLEDNRGKSKG